MIISGRYTGTWWRSRLVSVTVREWCRCRTCPSWTSTALMPSSFLEATASPRICEDESQVKYLLNEMHVQAGMAEMDWQLYATLKLLDPLLWRMAKTANCTVMWKGCSKTSTVHASLLGMYHLSVYLMCDQWIQIVGEHLFVFIFARRRQNCRL